MAVVIVEISESRNRFSSLKSVDVSSTLEERFFHNGGFCHSFIICPHLIFMSFTNYTRPLSHEK